ncbi:Unknown protein sequence [Pseudomonas syringae pv. cilantro]|uniref:Uncharacterized protein n=1 Tax=Pseudomonas syringae pv. cilantro TaxID=81035 RepID=A0A0N0GDL3_PSESX|nr:Unknown protein sequence [Pseudomonas syringae pv. cilantro]
MYGADPVAYRAGRACRGLQAGFEGLNEKARRVPGFFY